MNAGQSESTLCELFIERVPVSGASITVFSRPGAQSTICTSGALSTRLDQLQFDLGEGPRWEAARTGRPSVSEDVGHDGHPAWPVFGAAAARLGVGALFSFPLRIGTDLLGVADLYRDHPGALGHDGTSRAVAVALRVAAAAIGAASRSAASPSGAESGSAEMRREVHQATGMILMQLDIDPAAAFAVLRAHAFALGRTVDAVARDVVARRIDFGAEPTERSPGP